MSGIFQSVSCVEIRPRVIKILGALCIVFSVFSAPVHATAPDAASTPNSCQKFVQSYYDWYVSKNKSNFENALKARPEVFNPALLRRLAADVAAQAKDADNVVGLDFDPVLNSQDPSAHYSAGSAHAKNGHWLVDVYSVNSGKKSTKPDVTPELSCRNGKFQFENFHYSNSDTAADNNLIFALESCQKNREKDALSTKTKQKAH